MESTAELPEGEILIEHDYDCSVNDTVNPCDELSQCYSDDDQDTEPSYDANIRSKDGGAQLLPDTDLNVSAEYDFKGLSTGS